MARLTGTKLESSAPSILMSTIVVLPAIVQEIKLEDVEYLIKKETGILGILTKTSAECKVA
ncbi:hypothetical protein [Bradyrhizobium zhanjiangense]|uniref:Uncharacterized protein n=1 Tax=Bradyrhizobium zhanjiangense TaxID=1325107 RepID=A0A4Q0QHL9_9BRAD|nr:hypothetical protein [Bradyrhizobium zhanjiangense]RXG91996.1 hypothetical protein EAS61_23950 [Bradyrhizobium zhanjiangense]